ncbi:hypothetical protein [Pigmentiphaga sp. CHJ604]|uniref:hypothetical protein n=1 Tax=Pigmentiphaga sp. CHJ604 TaxID=3081984 RepID=UPI0030D18326
MSVYAIEQALFDIASDPQETNAYRADPRHFLTRYRLDPQECRLILDMDVKNLIGLAINPMLTMRAFTAIEGRDSMPEYMRRIRPPVA